MAKFKVEIGSPSGIVGSQYDSGGRLHTMSRIRAGDGTAFAATESGHFPVSLENVVIIDQVDGAAINTNIWTYAVSGMTITQSGGFMVLNNAASVTSGHWSAVVTNKRIPFYGEFPVEIDIGAKVNVEPKTNLVMELGCGNHDQAGAPTDGVYFRWAADGTFRAVICYDSVETVSAALIAPEVDVQHDFDMTVDNDEVIFEIDGEEVAELETPAGQAFPFNGTRMPIFCRTYHSGTVSGTAGKLSVGRLMVTQLVVNQNRPWDETVALMGKGAYQNPITTFGQLANHANSTSPTSATLSNTAAGYTTLGGRYQFATVAGAATDYALFAFQVPAGHQLILKGIRISAVNTGAAVATTATILDWSLGANSSAVSLATADNYASLAWGSRRIPLGIQGFVVGDAIGKAANDIVVNFEVPIVIDTGRYLHVILQMPVGTATSSQVIRGDVMLNGYFD